MKITIEMIEDKMNEISHMLIVDYPQGDFMDGYVDALEWILDIMEASE